MLRWTDTHQWIGVGVALRTRPLSRLLAILQVRSDVITDVFRSHFEKRRSFGVSTALEGVRLEDPVGRIFPRCTLTVRLQKTSNPVKTNRKTIAGK